MFPFKFSIILYKVFNKKKNILFEKSLTANNAIKGEILIKEQISFSDQALI